MNRNRELAMPHMIPRGARRVNSTRHAEACATSPASAAKWNLILIAALLSACSRDATPVKAIVGAKALSAGSEPVANAIVIVRAGRIVQLGAESQVSFPPGSHVFEARGKFLIAAPVEIPAYNVPEIGTREEARVSIAGGRRVMFGMFQDVEQLDEKFVQKLDNEETIFIPRLHRLEKRPDQLARASRHAKTLADGGVMIAAGAGPNSAREIELLTKAGLTPGQIFEAVTKNAAYAAGRSNRLGAVKENFQADLWLLDENPLVNPAALARPRKIMREGEWID